jgi:hypothetical protein
MSYISLVPKGLDVTLMKRLIDTYGDECTRMLTTQYRMNTLIMQWVSDRLYESRLVADTTVADHLLTDLNHVESNENTTLPLVLIDTHGCEMYEMVSENPINDEISKANLGEAQIACKHAIDLLNSGLKQEQIAIISPYNLQIELIRNKLNRKYPKIEVKSVDGFQGREKEAVILTLVRSNRVGEVGFLADQRRINVAITRAKRHLCVICDTQTCKTNEFLKSFIGYCNENGDVRTGFDYEHNTDDLDEVLEVMGSHGLKYVEPNKTTKSGPVQQQSKTRLNIRQEDQKTKNKNTTKQKEPDQSHVKLTDEDKKFEESVVAIIHNLSDRVHEFPSTLNARQRRIVHEIAERLQIFHLSHGEGDNRTIKLSKLPIEIEKKSVPDVIEAVQDTTSTHVQTETDETGRVDDQHDELRNKFEILGLDDNSTTSKKPVKSNKDMSLIGVLDDDYELKYRNDCKQCAQCGKFILKSNSLMHELHCARRSQTSGKSERVVARGQYVELPAEKVQKPVYIKEDRLKTAKTDDFDDLIAITNQMNNVCNFKKCKTLVQVSSFKYFLVASYVEQKLPNKNVAIGAYV